MPWLFDFEAGFHRLAALRTAHCVKSVQNGVFSGPYFPVFGLNTDIYCKSPYSVRIQENTDQKKLRIWTLFTQWPDTSSEIAAWESVISKPCLQSLGICEIRWQIFFFEKEKNVRALVNKKILKPLNLNLFETHASWVHDSEFRKTDVNMLSGLWELRFDRKWKDRLYTLKRFYVDVLETL